MNTSQQTNENPDHDQRLKVLEEENELLLLQLHQAQEELEHYFIKNQELKEMRESAITSQGYVDDELLATVAEAERLRIVVAVQSRVHEVQIKNALNTRRLSKVLIRIAKSIVHMLMISGKLLKTWLKTRGSQTSTTVGDKVYPKAIAAYRQCGFKFTGMPRLYLLLVIATHIKGGFQPTRKILAALAFLPSLHAKAYSSLVSYLIKAGNMKAIKKMAWRAYAINPNISSLKRLAFQLDRAGQPSGADAVLEVLPKDIVLNDSETRKVNGIRKKAKEFHLRKARGKPIFVNHRVEVMRQMAVLTEARDEQAKLAAERQIKLEEQSKLAAERQAKINQLEVDLSELQARQSLYAEEMAKAEGQLEIIKEVLLRGSDY